MFDASSGNASFLEGIGEAALGWDRGSGGRACEVAGSAAARVEDSNSTTRSRELVLDGWVERIRPAGGHAVSRRSAGREAAASALRGAEEALRTSLRATKKDWGDLPPGCAVHVRWLGGRGTCLGAKSQSKDAGMVVAAVALSREARGGR